MTYPGPAPHLRVEKDVDAAVRRMKYNAITRNLAMERVRLVREGKFAEVWPDQFSTKYPTSVIANFVDQSVRDLASNLAPLPSLMCASGPMKSDADKKRAATKNRIGYSYWLHADLEYQLKWGTDQYLTYAFLPVWIEADYECKKPMIHVEDPEGAYYELDRRGRTRRYARVWRQDIHELAAMFPEYESAILKDKYGNESEAQQIEVVRYIDHVNVTMYLPERNGLVVAKYRHGMPYCPVHIAERPGLNHNPRGQFDDVLWVQLAASVMAALTLEAAHKAVEAPITVPNDATEINFGPDAIIQTDHGDLVRRVEIAVPPAAFALGQQLKEEMKEGAGYPGTRLGQPGQANVTGRGIGALEGGFDSQIKLGQDVIGRLLRLSTATAFEMDVLLWPNRAKKIDGTLSGESFSLTYTPAKDIGDNFHCAISYGFGTGANPASAIVTMLQLRGDELVTRDTVRRQLPFDVDPDHEQRMLDIQTVEDGLKAGLSAALQASGQMIAQGQIQEAVQFFKVASRVIQGRREGADLAELILSTFAEAEQEQEQEAADAAQAQAAAQGGMPGAPDATGGAPLAGVEASGLLSGVAPGQAGMAPGGRPGVTNLTAGFTGSGAPAMQASVHRRVPTG